MLNMIKYALQFDKMIKINEIYKQLKLKIYKRIKIIINPK